MILRAALYQPLPTSISCITYCPVLHCLALSYPTLPYPALPYPTLPSPYYTPFCLFLPYLILFHYVLFHFVDSDDEEMREYESKWETFVARSNGIRAGNLHLFTDSVYTDLTLFQSFLIILISVAHRYSLM